MTQYKIRFHFLVLIASLAGILSSCGGVGQKERLVTDEVSREIRAKEPIRIREAELIERAHTLGRQLADSAQKALQGKLLGAIQEGGIPYAVDFCHVAALPLMDSLSQKFDVEIRRVSHRLRNPEDAPRDYEAPILEAYVYNFEEGLEMNDNVQKVGDDYFLYTKPILMGNALCLNCHGQPGTQVQEATFLALQEKYPNDNALGHELNDLRGIWSIRLARRMLVLQD
jgi:hypothetical protein